MNYVIEVKNVVVDELFRELFNDIEWSLDCYVFYEICFIFGKLYIDCFCF